jgi:hypothetical protein
VPTLHNTTYNNALYAVSRDNSGLPVDEARHRRFIAAALPHARDNPSIFYNVACAFMELGDVPAALANIALALEHGFERPEQIRADSSFKSLRRDPRFIALFGPRPDETVSSAGPAGRRRATRRRSRR